MISLYFNCFLVENKSDQLSHSHKGFFYPVTYPKSQMIGEYSQYDILVKAIKSYSTLEFDEVVFNLDIPYATKSMKSNLLDLIKCELQFNNLQVFFNRPSTVVDWKKDVEKNRFFFKPNTPILVVMNHDHLFIDYSTLTIDKVISQVFPESDSNFGKVLYYSHAPEVISTAINNKGHHGFHGASSLIYKSERIDDWIDSLGIMTIETLAHIWDNLLFDGDYIGRFDWPGVRYKSLNVALYVYPREFFRHFDGYGHVTGIRLFSESQYKDDYPAGYPDFYNKQEMVDFYYQRWIDCFTLTVRDYIVKFRFELGPVKEFYVDAIEFTIKQFRMTYLEMDCNEGLITKDEVKFIEDAIISMIFYNANQIFNDILVDIKLLKQGKVKEMFFLVNYYIRKVYRRLPKLISS
jgi:hypothetical protein